VENSINTLNIIYNFIYCFLCTLHFLLFLQRETSLQTQCPIPYPLIRIYRLPRQTPRPADEICFQLLPIQVGIVPIYNPPLHHQRRRSGHKWSGKGSSCHRLISAACAGGDNIYTRCRQLWFDRMPQSCKSTTGKICIRLRGVIVRPHRDRPAGGRWDCQRRVRRCRQKTCFPVQCHARWQPQIILTIPYFFWNQTDFPEPVLNVASFWNQIQINLLRLTVWTRHPII